MHVTNNPYRYPPTLGKDKISMMVYHNKRLLKKLCYDIKQNISVK
jgi:hypothetical protein